MSCCSALHPASYCVVLSFVTCCFDASHYPWVYFRCTFERMLNIVMPILGVLLQRRVTVSTWAVAEFVDMLMIIRTLSAFLIMTDVADAAWVIRRILQRRQHRATKVVRGKDTLHRWHVTLLLPASTHPPITQRIDMTQKAMHVRTVTLASASRGAKMPQK